MRLAETELFRRLVENSPFSEAEMNWLIATAPSRYKDHFIDKRRGGRRLISQPTKEIKFLQRLVVSKEFRELSINAAAIGYREGKSTLDHARPHAENRYLLKLDFKDFFPSLTSTAFDICLSRDTTYSQIERWALSNLLFRKPPGSRSSVLRLSIGAPSSPFVSNYMLHEFDSCVQLCAAQRGVVYTRYADDLAFSTSSHYVLSAMQQDVRRVISDLGYLRLSLNEEKTVDVSKKRRRTLVGLVLTNDGKVSLGRDMKRNLRAALHSFSVGKLPSGEVASLRGKLAYAYGVEPRFVQALCQRYGYAGINSIHSTGG